MNRSLLLERIRELTRPLSPRATEHPNKLQRLPGIRCLAFEFYRTIFISAVGDIGIDEEQPENAEYFTDSLKSVGFNILTKTAGPRGQTLFEESIGAHITAAKKEGIDYPEPDVRKLWLEVLQKLGEEKQIAGPVTEAVAQRFGIGFEVRINAIWPVPHLEATLHSLLDHGLQLGIISNSQFYTPLAFEAFLGAAPEKFGFNPRLLIWSFKTGRKKPSLPFYREFSRAAKKEGLQPEEILYVGNDIRKDVQPAKMLGMRTALYVGDRRSLRHQTGELDNDHYRPDLIIDDLRQIEECLV